MISLRKKFAAVEISDTGKVRDHNEDAIGSNRDAGLFVLADGMGGYNAGEVASGMATTVIKSEVAQILGNVEPHLVDEKTNKVFAELILREQIRKANASIYQAAQSQSQYAGMGTTLVVCLFYDNRVMVGHLGDSRLYRMRGTKLSQVTRDHSLLQEQIDAGLITPEQAKTAAHKNLVTRALGIDPGIEPELHEYATQPGDIYLLCSDGLPDMVEDEDIHLTISTFNASLDVVGQQLIELANDHGGRDNVSVMLAQVLGPFAARKPLLTRITSLFR